MLALQGRMMCREDNEPQCFAVQDHTREINHPWKIPPVCHYPGGLFPPVHSLATVLELGCGIDALDP